MARNPFDVNIKPINILGPEKSEKRVLGIRDKQILYHRANCKCEACGKKIDFTEMQTGHKKAASKGGHATLENSVCLCYKCNKLQGTDSWEKFMKKMGKDETRTVTSRKPRENKPKTDKPKKKKSGNYIINPLTGEKMEPLIRF